MPSTTTDRSREERRDPTRIAVGSAMAGGSGIYRARNAERSGTSGLGEVAMRTYRNRRLSGADAKFSAKHLAVGGVIGTGIHLAVDGSQRKRRMERDKLRVKRDVISGSVRRTVPGGIGGGLDRESAKEALQEKYRSLPGLAGGMLGGMAAAKGAGLTGARIAGRKYLATGLAGGGGMIAGGITGDYAGKYARRKHAEMKKQRVIKLANPDMSAAEASDRAKQRARRKQQQALSLTSAGLGVTALAMKAPQITRMAMRSKAPKAVIDAERRMNEPSNLVGTGAIGVGSLGSLNFARINRADNDLETKYGVKKELDYVYDEVSKLGVPRIRPVRFAGVRSGGFYRRSNGVMGYRRGSLG